MANSPEKYEEIDDGTTENSGNSEEKELFKFQKTKFIILYQLL